MPQPIIEIKNLSKEYTLFHKLPYYTLRDMLTNVVKKPLDVLRGKAGSHEREKFLALKDINFSIQQGERVGIIGRNGAGKSTLLKILSQITPPTTGEICLRGRVASLLEVGTGFHPELTGRENIYLNGAILGMKQKEIAKKFDEIVAFAEIEKFLDTPVKRYSSGMYVRLAFAVAAHLEPEILIVDEVLAVGDVQFQKKCLGKMREAGKSGRTVIFVSHNMGAVNQLCEKCLLLDNGQLIDYGTTPSIVKQYMQSHANSQSQVRFDPKRLQKGCGACQFIYAELRNEKNELTNQFYLGDDVALTLGVQRKDKKQDVMITAQIFSSDGTAIVAVMNSDTDFNLSKVPDWSEVTIIFKDIRLVPDTYSVKIWMGSATGYEMIDEIENAIQFDIIVGGNLTARQLPRSSGLIFLTPEWKNQKANE